MSLPQPGDLQWADPMNGYLTDLLAEADMAASDLNDHEDAQDPHGSLPQASANAAAKVAAHAVAADPHGDRANTTAQIAGHSVANDPHGDRADATARVNSHVSASDPHGDKAYVNSLITKSTINGTGLAPVYAFVAPSGGVASPTDWQGNSGSLNCFVQLQVPPSGKVLLDFGFSGRNSNTSGSYIRCAPYLTYITNIPGSSDILPTGDNAVYAAPDGITSVWRKILFSGLVPGPIQIELQFDISSGDDTTSKFQDQWIIATPIP